MFAAAGFGSCSWRSWQSPTLAVMRSRSKTLDVRWKRMSHDAQAPASWIGPLDAAHRNLLALGIGELASVLPDARCPEHPEHGPFTMHTGELGPSGAATSRGGSSMELRRPVGREWRCGGCWWGGCAMFSVGAMIAISESWDKNKCKSWDKQVVQRTRVGAILFLLSHFEEVEPFLWL